MSHPSDGKLYTYVDQALSPDERSAIDLHLAQCERCRNRVHQLAQRNTGIRALLDETETQANITPPVIARRRFVAYAQTQKEQTMHSRIQSHRLRPAWTAVVILLVLGLSLTLAPVRTMASQFLALFRVEKIKFVELNPYALPAGLSFENAAMEIDQLMQDNLVVKEDGDLQVVDTVQASELVDFTPRYSELMGENVKITAAPALTMSMQVDAAEVQRLLDTLGYTQHELPSSLDGADIQIQLEPSLSMSTPACEDKDTQDCVVFVQVPSPSVSAPPELNVYELGMLYLQLLGMNEQEASAFNRNVDWTSTLVVPVPHNQAKYTTVYIDGEAGTLVSSYQADQETEYALVWMKDDVIHAIIGKGESDMAIKIARSLTE